MFGLFSGCSLRSQSPSAGSISDSSLATLPRFPVRPSHLSRARQCSKLRHFCLARSSVIENGSKLTSSCPLFALAYFA